MMKLYFSPGSCALASNIALHEAGIAFDAIKVDLRAKQTASAENYLAINPKGYVPALLTHSGEVLTENVAVLPYIADLKPAAQLAPAPADPERYRLLEWLGFISSEIHKSFSTFFKPNASEDWKQAQKENLIKRLDYLQGVLSGRTFLMGAVFTVADAYLFTILRWHGKAGIVLEQWPAIQAYFERVKARPAVVAALELEGLLKK